MSAASTSASFRARVVLRPRSLDEVFDLALAYLRSSFRDLSALVGLCTLLPVALALVGGGIVRLLGGDQSSVFVTAALSLLVSGSALETAVVVFVGRHLFQNPPSLSSALWAALRNAPRSATGALFMWGPPAFTISTFTWGGWPVLALVVFAWFPIGATGLALVGRYFHVREVRQLEHLRGDDARRRAVTLSDNRGGRNFAFMFQASLLRALFAISAAGAGHAVIGWLLQFEGHLRIVAPVAGGLGFALAGPYIGLAKLFDYVDARTRLEGWDIQVRFQDISSRISAAGERL